jgi:tetraacyldisaccharide-1-P 4'-kinase
LKKIRRLFSAAGAEALVTTEKDAVKIEDAREAFGQAPVYVFKIGLAIEPGFIDRVNRFLSGAEKTSCLLKK